MKNNKTIEEGIEIFVAGIDDTPDGVVDSNSDGVVNVTEEELQEVKDTAWEFIPIVGGVLLVVAIIASTVCCMQGCCCECFYSRCKVCQKYQKPKQAAVSDAAALSQENYSSM